MAREAGASVFTPEWVIAQRWFRSKQRPIATVAEVDRAALPHSVASLAVLAIAYVDGGENDLYLVPDVGGREPEDGDGAWRSLLAAVAARAELHGIQGRFLCTPTPHLERLLAGHAPARLTERRLRVEQSNTSVVLGEVLILKLFRLLEVGVNPDLEVSAFLADVGFAGTPALAGSVSYVPAHGPPAAAAIVQELVPAGGDAWAWMLAALAEDPERGIAGAGEIGALTASLHVALGSRPAHREFPARPATVDETAAWRASAERQLAGAVAALHGEAHERLVTLAPRLRERFADSFGRASSAAIVTRIHGDYHLGQVLHRRDDRFVVIDFEGEPARPMHERRAPGSPLRDVAGMLRSLDYAARTASSGGAAHGFDPAAWLARARTSFLDAYRREHPIDDELLAAFELEKACYEVRYEAGNRPDWLWLPLGALERLAA